MIRRQSLSAYTPSNTDPAILQRIFVQREELLSLIVKRLCNSATTGDMYHALLVGPRGSGKTHFVSLVEWEFRQRNELANNLRICWLGEDDSFTALIYLAFGIARQLAVAYPKEFPADFKEAVRGLPQQDAALAILRNVISNLGDRTLLLITENLDQTFPSLGKNGRAAWRAFLQENRCIATLATSQLLFDDVSKRDEAFFGFFDIHHLEALSVNDAHELIRRISIEQKKRELINYLSTAEGRYRVRALHYLAGGNHRMYVLLSEFLTRDTLDSLVNAFEDLAEEMTPYFQERMRALPDQQRQIAQCLCDAEGAMTVKNIAGETFIDERTVSKQLSNLKTRRYVCSVKRGKESYYDMAEPLMRLCLEVKNQRGEPLRMVVRFLKAWFPESTLTTKSEITKLDARVDAYSQMAVLTNSAFNDAIAQTIDKEISTKIYEGSFAEASALARELQFANKPGALLREAQLAELQGEGFEHALTKYTAVIEMAEAPVEQRAMALRYRGWTYGQQGEIELKLTDYTAVIEMAEAPAEQRAIAQCGRGVTYGQQGEIELELADYTAVIEMAEAPAEQRAIAQRDRGVAYGQQGEIELALADYTAVIEMAEVPVEERAGARNSRGTAYWQVGQFESAAEDFKAVLSTNESGVSDSKHVIALFNLVEPLIAIATLEEVLKTLDRALSLRKKHALEFAGTPKDILSMILKRPKTDWSNYCSGIATRYIENDLVDQLGQGLTRSIELLDMGDFTAAARCEWVSIWRAVGDPHDGLSIPLRCLDAAVAVINSDPPSDVPLLGLPPEMRTLVRPMLNVTLGEDHGGYANSSYKCN